MDTCPDCKKYPLLKKMAKTALINGWMREFHIDCALCGQIWIFTYDGKDFKANNRLI